MELHTRSGQPTWARLNDRQAQSNDTEMQLRGKCIRADSHWATQIQTALNVRWRAEHSREADVAFKLSFSIKCFSIGSPFVGRETQPDQ